MKKVSQMIHLERHNLLCILSLTHAFMTKENIHKFSACSVMYFKLLGHSGDTSAYDDCRRRANIYDILWQN